MRLQEAQKLNDWWRSSGSFSTWNVGVFAVGLVVNAVSDATDISDLNVALSSYAFLFKPNVFKCANFFSNNSSDGFVAGSLRDF